MRIRDTGKTDCYWSVIAASNKIGYRGQLNERGMSNLREEVFVFESTPVETVPLAPLLTVKQRVAESISPPQRGRQAEQNGSVHVSTTSWSLQQGDFGRPASLLTGVENMRNDEPRSSSLALGTPKKTSRVLSR